jgi:hypothetical protein
MLAINDEEKCKIIYGVSNYETRKKWVNTKKTDEFKYELIHSTPQNGIRYMYSSRNDNGHYTISKIIFGDSGIYNSIIDINGIYGMTQHSMAIKINDLNEGIKIKNVIESNNFKIILNACSWSNFQIDWRLFTYFKKKFYNDFIIDDINNDTNINENKTKIIKDGRKQYYLIEDKLYKVKKDKSQGDLFGTYIDGKIEEVEKKKVIKKPSKEDNYDLVDKPIIEVKKKKVIKKPSKEDNHELIDEPIIEVKKKKVIKKPSKEDNHELIDEPIIEVKKKKTIKKPTKEDNHELIDEPIIEVKKKKTIKKPTKEDNHKLIDEPIIEVKKKKSIVIKLKY